MNNDMEMMLPVYRTAAQKVLDELVSARKRFDQMRSPHEGWAIIHEEMCELWDEVRDNKGSSAEYQNRLYGEALQVTAMGLAFLVEVTMMGNGIHHDERN